MNPRLDADALMATLQPPSIRLGGAVYVGRLLPVDEWSVFRERLLALNDNSTGMEVSALSRDYLRAVFPKKWWRPDPVPKLMALPEKALAEVMAHFFRCQWEASVGVPLLPSEATPTSNGTDSLPLTPPA